MAFNPLILIGVGGAALLLLAKPSSAKTPKPGEPGGLPGSSLPGANAIPPNDVVQRVLTAVASQDPAKLRAEADKLEREGWAAQAADLRGVAVQLEKAKGGGASYDPTKPPSASNPYPLPAIPGVPVSPPVPVPIPNVQLPTANPSAPPVVVPVTATPPLVSDPQYDLAGRLALSLHTKGRGTEDKKLVAAFQTQESATGYYTGKIDGLYGPKSALALAKHWALVPPKPLYWPKAQAEATKAKAEYRTQLLAIAAKDAPRADEWQKAATV